MMGLGRRDRRERGSMSLRVIVVGGSCVARLFSLSQPLTFFFLFFFFPSLDCFVSLRLDSATVSSLPSPRPPPADQKLTLDSL